MDMCICGHSAREHGPTGECHAAGCRCKHFTPEIRHRPTSAWPKGSSLAGIVGRDDGIEEGGHGR